MDDPMFHSSETCFVKHIVWFLKALLCYVLPRSLGNCKLNFNTDLHSLTCLFQQRTNTIADGFTFISRFFTLKCLTIDGDTIMKNKKDNNNTKLNVINNQF